MPWARYGDDAATHPIVLGVLERGELQIGTLSAWDRANLVFGFVSRCALYSAGHLTDHFISRGAVMTMGGPDAMRWAEEARRAGYWKKAKKDGQTGYQLVDLDDFIHIRLKADVEWDRQQRSDNKNPDLIMPVRLRDGDACRYCGNVVYWADRKGARGATYDHRNPSSPATVETLVVSCRSCNAGRRDRVDADDRYPLLPAPLAPYYSQGTIAQLVKHGLTPTRSGSQPDHAPRDPAPAPDTAQPSRPDSQPGTAPKPSDLQIRADPLPNKSGSAGSGRVGTGVGGAGSGSQSRTRPRARRGRPR